MKSLFGNSILIIATVLNLSGCGPVGAYSNMKGSSSAGSVIAPGGNIAALVVEGSKPNIPMISLTICVPGTSNCQTISNILVDTGSYGLRIFSSLISIPLAQRTNSANVALAECMSYGDGSEQWGPVVTADVIIASEKATSVPIESINAAYATEPPDCSSAEASPSDAGFNGILGVGQFAQDCGAACVTSVNNELYYACTGTNCVYSTAPMSAQVTNPVAFMPLDNNGVIMTFPTVSASGAKLVPGSLTLGIGTQANNTPGAVTTFPADSSSNFTTIYNGTTYSAFIDSGSNGLFFPSTAITSCASGQVGEGWFCPTSPVSSSATMVGYNSSVSQSIPFSISNFATLYYGGTGNNVFNDNGANISNYFDWGFPFFLGRSVYVGIQNRASVLGVGPYWAF